MIDGLAVIDAHMHVPRLSTVSSSWMQWAVDYGRDSGWQTVFDADGDPDPARLDALLDAEGVDAALDATKIDGIRRGETLDIAEFAAIAAALPVAATRARTD